MAATRTPARRRQRSVRVSVAVALLVVATVAVLAALPTQSPLFLSISSVLALVLGWAALRMAWTEVLQSRRENSRDRAAAAAAYRTLFSQRAAEHAEFTTAMTERLAESQMSRRELEATLEVEQQRAGAAEARLTQATGRLDAAQQRVQTLERELSQRQAEEADALALWEAEGGELATGAAALADLVAFEHRSGGGQASA